METQRYRMPAEWEEHRATWLAWPHPRTPQAEGHPHWPHTFRPKNIPRYWAQMARHLTGEEVHILSHHAETRAEIIAALEKEQPGLSTLAPVYIHDVPNNWPWIRDSGGITVVDDRGGRAMTHWGFNGWGYGMWEYDLDCQVPAHMSRISGMARREIGMMLEGGSIDVNGKGTLLTTEACLLNPNRNLPGQKRTRKEIERALGEHLGAEHVLWLAEGIGGDDTSGHIDDLARFVNPSTIMTVVQQEKNDENHEPLQKNLRLLQHMRDQNGKQLTVAEVPLPKPRCYRGQRLPMSYANFYIGNRAVLVPVFNDPHDIIALRTLEQAFPDRRIVDIDATDLVWGLGSFHCLTQQEPAASVPSPSDDA